jgi:CubicO group peptidase (beta-lactamase class C family)
LGLFLTAIQSDCRRGTAQPDQLKAAKKIRSRHGRVLIGGAEVLDDVGEDVPIDLSHTRLRSCGMETRTMVRSLTRVTGKWLLCRADSRDIRPPILMNRRRTSSHILNPFPLLLGWLVLAGCTDDGTIATDDGDDTGTGYVEPSPYDPLDGEGSDPPGDPDEGATWAPAEALGSGLVHDSRYDLEASEHTKVFTGAELNAGVDWATGFVTEHAAKVSVGFRPVQVDGFYDLVPLGTNDDGTPTFELSVTDRSVYLSDDDANYKTVTKTYVFGNPEQERDSLPSYGSGRDGGPRPTAIDTFSIDADTPPVGTTIVWTYDANPVPWRLIVGESQAEFGQTVENLRGQGYRPISIASRRRLGGLQYAAIFVADGVPGDDWRVTFGAYGSHQSQGYDNWEDGFYPSQHSFADKAPFTVGHNIIWTRTPPRLRVEVRENLDRPLFEALDADFRKQGYNLQSATLYNHISYHRRYAGIWVQYEPYLRWQGTQWDLNDETDALHQERYQPIHDQVIQTMTFQGTSNEGEVFRPSATLHVLEGADLVLSRAYTYAPAIYPDTPENAAFALASVSKSITAAALVREMNLKGLPLTTDFWPLIGVSPYPSTTAVPTVKDVLRNLGGFTPSATSFNDHNLVRNAGYGGFPVTATMLHEYALGEGRYFPPPEDAGLTMEELDAIRADTFWFEERLDSQEWTYSNVGFMLLGEAIRRLSQSDYETYVRQFLLAPTVGLDDIYANPGHRRTGDRVTMATIRSYLSQTGHAYRSGTTQSPPLAPRSRSEPTPEPLIGVFKDGAATWSANTGPTDEHAPLTSALERYSGTRHMGSAPLAAGGWIGRGEALGRLVRAIATSTVVMPASVAARLWSPNPPGSPLDEEWWTPAVGRAARWQYGLGWYARGNWIAAAGGTVSSSAIVMHNLQYDITIVYLTNTLGQAFGDFANPLLNAPQGNWSTDETSYSDLGGIFPCIDNPTTTATDECGDIEASY